MKDLIFFKAFAMFLILIDLPTIWSLLLGSVILYYTMIVCQKPKIHTGNTTLKTFLLKNVPSIHKKFIPSPLYWEGRLQTIFGLRKRLPNHIKLPYKREILQLKDGGQLGIDYIDSEVNPPGLDEANRLTVLVLPGLTSSSQTSYVKTLVKSILKTGANVVVYNTRGLGGVDLITPKWACAANCEDLRQVTEHIRKTKLREGEKLFVVGASFGGMLLCQMLINYPNESKSSFLGSLVISTIFDMEALLDSLATPYLNKYVLNQSITLDILYRAKKFPKVMNSRPEAWDFTYACEATTLTELDRRLTCPMFDYSGPEEYYKNATTVHRLNEIPIPLFVLNALDDPMQPGESLPLKQTKLNRSTNVAFITTPRGGHLGFVEGIHSKSEHFMERFTFELVSAVGAQRKTLLRATTMSG